MFEGLVLLLQGCLHKILGLASFKPQKVEETIHKAQAVAIAKDRVKEYWHSTCYVLLKKKKVHVFFSRKSEESSKGVLAWSVPPLNWCQRSGTKLQSCLLDFSGKFFYKPIAKASIFGT